MYSVRQISKCCHSLPHQSTRMRWCVNESGRLLWHDYLPLPPTSTGGMETDHAQHTTSDAHCNTSAHTAILTPFVDTVNSKYIYMIHSICRWCSLVHGLLRDVSQKIEQVAHQGALTSIHMAYKRRHSYTETRTDPDHMTVISLIPRLFPTPLLATYVTFELVQRSHTQLHTCIIKTERQTACMGTRLIEF